MLMVVLLVIAHLLLLVPHLLLGVLLRLYNTSGKVSGQWTPGRQKAPFAYSSMAQVKEVQ